MKKLAIIGAGDLGQQITNQVIQDQQYEVVGYFDDFRKIGEVVHGIAVLGGIEDVQGLYDQGVFEQ